MQSTQKADHAGRIMERKRARWLAKKPDLVRRLEDNNGLVAGVEKEVGSCPSDVAKKELECSVKAVDLDSCEKKVQHLQQMLKMQHLEAARSEA